MLKINVENLTYKDLNAAVRKAGEDVEIAGALGERFIGAGLSDKNLIIKAKSKRMIEKHLRVNDCQAVYDQLLELL